MFRASPASHATRLVAALVLAAFAAGVTALPSMPVRIIGGALVVGALVWAGQCGWSLYRERRDSRYDLSRLWDTPPPAHEEPDEDPAGLDRDLVYCHNCGASMPRAFAVCPDCGNRLGY